MGITEVLDAVVTLLSLQAQSDGYDEDAAQAQYTAYLKKQSSREEALQAQRETRHVYAPLFSVISPQDAGVEKTLRAQTYAGWEHVRTLGEANGEYVLYLGPKDRLAPEALHCFVELLTQNEKLDFIYADEDISGKSGHKDPYFKPSLSIVTLLSFNCVGAPLVCSRDLALQAGGRMGFDDTSEYEYALACALRCKYPHHIPRVLLSRTAQRGRLDEMRIRAAMEACLKQRKEHGSISPGLFRDSFRLRPVLKKDPSIGVVIPNRNGFSALRRLLESIEYHGGNYTLIIVDYGSRDPQTLDYYEALKKNKAVKVVRAEEYNYARLCNLGAARLNTELLLFLDPNTEVIAPDWLFALAEQALRPETGAVSGKLLDEGGHILEAGRVVGLGGWIGSLYAGTANDTHHLVKNRFVNAIRAVSTVSGSFLMLRTDAFYNVGCFDESMGTVGAAAELCMRLLGRGYTNIYTPYAELKKHPAPLPEAAKEEHLTRCYDVLRPMLLQGDPFYNPNYDYANTVPLIAPEPYPAIRLNPHWQ